MLEVTASFVNKTCFAVSLKKWWKLSTLNETQKNIESLKNTVFFVC